MGPSPPWNVHHAFREVTTRIGLRIGTVWPRIHDLRHTFAVDTLMGWYRDGRDVAAMIPVLSTYLDHTKPANTYWYLTATPELLAQHPTGPRAGRRARGSAGGVATRGRRRYVGTDPAHLAAAKVLREQYQRPRPTSDPSEALVRDLADYDRAFGLIEGTPSDGEVA